jgi:hypothetical protein
MMSLLPSLAPLFLLGLSACTALYDDRCGFESRDVSVSERIGTAQGDSIGFAYVSLAQSREESLGKSASYIIESTDLLGHLGSARLVAAEDTANLLLPLPGTPYEPNLALQSGPNPYVATANFNELFLRARHGGLSMVIETDLASFQQIVLPLQLEQFSDWDRPHCS